MHRAAEILIERLGRPGEFDFHPGTAYAGDDRRLGQYLLTTAFHGCLGAAIDHFHAATVLVVQGRVVHVSADSSLARGILENAAAAFWMVHPSSRQKRLEHVLKWWAKNAIDQQKATDHLPATANRGATRGQQHAKIQAVATQNQITAKVTGGYTSTTAVEYFTGYAKNSLDGGDIGVRLAWQICSGFAHGRPWASMGVLNQQHFPSATVGVSNVRFTSDLATALYPISTGYELLLAVLREHQRRGRIQARSV